MNMEIISTIILGFGGYFIGDRLIRMRRSWFPPRAKSEGQPQLRSLEDQNVRSELTEFLRKQRVQGDANIRCGVVLPPVDPERLAPLSRVLHRATDLLPIVGNADSLYVRDQGQFKLTGMDLLDVADAATVIERVAEDRRRSRSLYKGLTDNEIKSLTRAGLSSWLKDDGRFSDSNEVMSGLWDDKPEFLMAQSVIELAFKVKGASND